MDDAPSTTRIRPAGPADAAEIAAVQMRSRVETMPYLPPQRRTHEQVTRWVEDIVLRDCRIWVAVDDGGRILGFAALEGTMLEHLYLLPETRRRGIGSRLLDQVRRHSPDQVTLHVFQQNTDARAFYAKHGFTVVDSTDGRGNMEKLPDLTLRWTPDRAPDGTPEGTPDGTLHGVPGER
ncbi:GNAT family N-acetyltransferase [Streptacidiphilus cavernicola]|uniref:N-acetyltransferase family protein n=1 Tax=Streptacidiphilus cavernicola TaxID=3342716 RepID=A0ABV6W0V6_9ACTN